MTESVRLELGPSRGGSSLFFNETSYLPHEIDWSYVNQEWPSDSSQTTHLEGANSWANTADTVFWPNTPQRMESGGLRSPVMQKVTDINDDSSLFSSSLPVLFKSQLTISDSGSFVANSTRTINGVEEEVFGSLEEMESHTIGSLLPGDEDELLAGVVKREFDVVPYSAEDFDDFDLFSSGGGLELEADMDPFQSHGSASEHPYGEHPSRTLFVRNINSNVEDSELRSLFEQYGDIRTLYTACKHRGFVMISYYDIRSARLAMRTLQGKALRRRKLDIHFSIPKDNPSDKDANQGTLVVFNLDTSVTNDDLRQKFGEYGEIKEIRETPHKKHHKFIEFYDVRSAEAALRALNKSDIAGKRIKLEPSRPGGARRSILQQISQEFDQEESYTAWTDSPPGYSAESRTLDSETLFASPKSASYRSFSPRVGSQITSPVRAENHNFPLRNHLVEHQDHHTHSLPEYLNNAHMYKSSGAFPSVSASGSFRHVEGFETRGLGRTNTGFVDGYSNGGSASLQRSSSLSASLWGTGPYSQAAKSSTSIWQNVSPSHSFNQRSGGDSHGNLYSSSFSPQFGSFTRDQSYLQAAESPEPTPYGHSGSYGRMGNVSQGMINTHTAPLEHGPSSPNFGMFLPPRLFGNVGSLDDRRVRRMDNGAAALQAADNKKQFQLDIERILAGDDARTTLMIKNIPNKYTSKMLLAAIDECHRGTYDFIYLPIDFKNKCNVGYAFINMLSPLMIPPFFETFNGKKWEKFNSEKVASLAYARIQGKTALIAHFQNSSLMNEDKRCRPIIFHSEGPNVGDQEPFPIGDNVRSRTAAYYRADALMMNPDDHLAHFGVDSFGGE